MGRYIVGNDCYPLFLVWKTGLCESIGDIIKDKFRREPGMVGGLAEAISDTTDLLIEKSIGRPLARPIWSEMKENAELCCGPGRGGDLFVTALQKLAATWGDALEIHLVGHSAGSIILGHLLTLATARGLKPNITSIHLYAPACTVQFATRHYATQTDLMERLYLDILSEQNERDDTVVALYRKSLLYLVSNALEFDLRTPILGMENVFKVDYAGWDGSSATGEVLGLWRQAAKAAGLDKRLQIVDTPKVITRLPDKQIKAGHGCFDNDIATVGRTLERIVGAKSKLPIDDLLGF
jgi:pimeloyl-ACP methyl ester carboxylesterase